MSLSNIIQVEKPLLSRTEVSAELSFTGKTPSREEVLKQLTEQLKAQHVVLKRIKSGYGSQVAKVDAYVYSSAESLKRFEQPKKASKEKAS